MRRRIAAVALAIIGSLYVGPCAPTLDKTLTIPEQVATIDGIPLFRVRYQQTWWDRFLAWMSDQETGASPDDWIEGGIEG